jgi:hypothetical protein
MWQHRGSMSQAASTGVKIQAERGSTSADAIPAQARIQFFSRAEFAAWNWIP